MRLIVLLKCASCNVVAVNVRCHWKCCQKCPHLYFPAEPKAPDPRKTLSLDAFFKSKTTRQKCTFLLSEVLNGFCSIWNDID